jgi:hypothetical protein
MFTNFMHQHIHLLLMMQFASINMFYAWRKNDIHEEQIHPSGYIKSRSEPPSKKMSRFEP